MSRLKSGLSFLLLCLAASRGLGFPQPALAPLKEEADRACALSLAQPSNFDLSISAVKCLVEYGEELEAEKPYGWAAAAKEGGRLGMALAEKSQLLKPDRVEGWYWFSQAVGLYADQASVFESLAEGLKDRTQRSLEKAYVLDRSYNSYDPILSLGRFWQELPAIAGGDLSKALTLYEEYFACVRAAHLQPNPDAYFFRGQLYRSQGKKALAMADFAEAARMGQKDALRLLGTSHT